MPTIPKRTIRPGQFVPNSNHELKILSVVLEGDAEEWAMLPVTGFLIEGTLDPPPNYGFVMDWPVSVTALDDGEWCLFDRDSGLCFSTADSDWVGALPLAEAKVKLADALRRHQRR